MSKKPMDEAMALIVKYEAELGQKIVLPLEFFDQPGVIDMMINVAANSALPMERRAQALKVVFALFESGSETARQYLEAMLKPN